VFVPKLRTAGVSDATLHTILERQPPPISCLSAGKGPANLLRLGQRSPKPGGDPFRWNMATRFGNYLCLVDVNLVEIL
jgi:hypothetical protein